MIQTFLLLSIFFLTTHPSLATREGTATAEVFIKRYTQTGDFGRLALWHEAAAECLKRISVPMNEVTHDYYKRHGFQKWATRAEKEAREIQEQYRYHCTRAESAWQNFARRNRPSDSFVILNTEREKIAKFMAVWLPRYPNRFYEFGIYPTFFRKQREFAEREGDYAKALHLEADAAEMCAAQYEKILIVYGLERYNGFRDAYLRHAMHLRKLAKQNPKILPPEVDQGKQMLDSLKTQKNPSEKRVGAILHIAKSDARVETILANQIDARTYAAFQGFVWIVNFSNHGHGNLATVIVDDKTEEVLDVF